LWRARDAAESCGGTGKPYRYGMPYWHAPPSCRGACRCREGRGAWRVSPSPGPGRGRASREGREARGGSARRDLMTRMAPSASQTLAQARGPGSAVSRSARDRGPCGGPASRFSRRRTGPAGPRPRSRAACAASEAGGGGGDAQAAVRLLARDLEGGMSRWWGGA
jgi:hypothetical protein